MLKRLQIVFFISYLCNRIRKQGINLKLKEMDKEFKNRVKKATDLIMYQSVSISFAVAIVAIDANDALNIRKYIKENL